MYFTIVGGISNSRVIAAGPSVRLRRHLSAKFGSGRWRKMAEESRSMTTTRRATSGSFAVCIHGDADHGDLIVGKVYRVMRPQRNDRAADVRIVDESGEDY